MKHPLALADHPQHSLSHSCIQGFGQPFGRFFSPHLPNLKSLSPTQQPSYLTWGKGQRRILCSPDIPHTGRYHINTYKIVFLSLFYFTLPNKGPLLPPQEPRNEPKLLQKKSWHTTVWNQYALWWIFSNTSHDKQISSEEERTFSLLTSNLSFSLSTEWIKNKNMCICLEVSKRNNSS